MSPKTAIVTGASSGIGEAIAEQLQRYGYDVWTIQRSPPSLTNVDWLPLDLAELTRGQAEIMLEVMPMPSVIVNNAGRMPLEQIDDWQMEQLFHLNVIAPELIMDSAIKLFAGHEMSILNVCSTAGYRSAAYSPTYGATKAALWSLTQSYAAKGAPSVRVNAISPGFTRTNLAPTTPEKMIQEHVPLGYEANPSEIAKLALNILHTPFMTGANVLIDGGELAGFACH